MTRHLNAYQKGLAERRAEANHTKIQHLSKMDSYNTCPCDACETAWFEAFNTAMASRTRARRLWSLQKATARQAVQAKRVQA